MTLVLILPAWLILLALVVGLCTAARVGDNFASCQSGGENRSGLPGTAEEPAEVSRPNAGRAAGAGARGRMPAGNVAA